MEDNSFSAANLIVDLRTLAANYDVLRKTSNAEVAAVVKADAYGLGLGAIAETLSASGCKTFFVALTAEGVSLRSLLPNAEIYVLTPCIERDTNWMIENQLKPCLYDIDDIHNYIHRSQPTGLQPRAALHVDTGINRLGLDHLQIKAFCDSDERGKIDVDLLMSHLACADEPDSEMNKVQLSRFRENVQRFPGVRASLANSAGIFLGPEYHFDLVRPGISLYGHDPHHKTVPSRVRPVVTFEARLGQVKNLSEGEYVGYGATVRCNQPTRIGVVLAGYADGIPRYLSDTFDGEMHSVFIAGHRAPLFGCISMDLTTIDLSGIPKNDIGIGSTVEIFGRNISIEEVAEYVGTIPYEILTQIGARVPRNYVS